MPLQTAVTGHPWAAEQGYEMIEVVEESGVSGTVALLERPGFSRLFDLVTGGEASVVVAQDADRISREPWHFGYLKAKLEEYGATLRTLDDAGDDDSPESEFFRDIRRGMAKMERSVTARRTRRGREQRAREGKVVGAGSPPLGFSFNADRTNFVIDEETMPLVRRVFRLVAEEGYGLSTVKKTLERERITTPRGGLFWHCPVLRDMILSDLYKPHTSEDLEALAERGQLSREVIAKLSLDAGASYGVWWYGRDATKRTGKLTATGGPARSFERRPKEDLIAVPVPDAGVPKEWVDAAREAIKDNVRAANAGRRLWELSGGVGYCACGRRLSIHTNTGRAGTRPQFHYVCSHRRRHGSGACPHAKFHKAEEIEGRVRAFVYRLLHDPEALRRQVLQQLELDRVSLGRVEEEAGFLLEQIAEADRERDGYLRLAAKGRISEEELDGYLAELEQRKDGAMRELDGLRDRRERLNELDELVRGVEEHLADIPNS